MLTEVQSGNGALPACTCITMNGRCDMVIQRTTSSAVLTVVTYWCALLSCGKYDVAGGSCSDLWGQERSRRDRQVTPGRQLPAPALTPPATQGMWESPLQPTPASQQGSLGPSLFLGGDSSAARGVATIRNADPATSTLHGSMHASGHKKASRLGNDTTTALANALSGIR